ncbi:MAG: hypothetical protein QM751_00165 [Paludibacteraceae bacterium]
MKRGNIKINKTSIEGIQVSIELSEDGTVWMTKSEIATLFNVYLSSVEANLKRLFQSKELCEKDMKKAEQRILGNGQKYVVEYFNLEAIIALSYRIKSYPCLLLRQWISTQVTISLKNQSQLDEWLGTTAKLN